MGYSYSVYAVDLAKLQKVWASADDKTKRALLKKQAERIEQNDKWFATRIEAGAPTLATCIDDIFAGKVTKKKFGYQYGYALEAICAHLGSRIEDLDMTWFAEFLDPYLKKQKQASTQKLIGHDVRPIAIPKADDFPEIGTIDAAGMTKLAAALDAIEDAVEEEDDGDAAEVIEELRGWLARAKKAKKQIVWFVY